MSVRYGIFLPNFGPFSDARALQELAAEAEGAGWDGLFLWDHIAFDVADARVVDPWIALTAVATATERLRMGALITPIARRRPWKLARETVSLDRLSGGRLVFGTGLGYSAPVEFAAFGETVDDRRRAEILDEGLELLDRFWSGEPVRFQGTHFEVDSVAFLPRPVQEPRIPVWVAGWWPHKRPMIRAARWDGVFPERAPDGTTPTPNEVQAIRHIISEHRQSDGPFDIVLDGESTPESLPATLAEYEGAGVTWWLEKVHPERLFSIEGARERIVAGPVAG